MPTTVGTGPEVRNPIQVSHVSVKESTILTITAISQGMHEQEARSQEPNPGIPLRDAAI